MCPKGVYIDFAFIGRSNVGKSSLINMLIGMKNMARTSVKPGKTSLINHYLINDTLCFVDLPGYGWASTSKENRYLWSKRTHHYILNRDQLSCLFVLIDASIAPQPIDLSFLMWCIENNVKYAIIFTKIDKISKNKISTNVNNFIGIMSSKITADIDYFLVSNVTKGGKDDIWQFIESRLG